MEEVYCLAPRLKRTETTRGPGNMCFQILMRSSEGSFEKSGNAGEESICAVDIDDILKLRSCLGGLFEVPQK